MKCFVLMAAILFSFVAAPAQSGKVAKDKFPAGQKSPEGVACDLARAFINHDKSLFLATIVKGESSQREYQEFKVDVAKAMAKDKSSKSPSAFGPRSIVKCFAARNMSRNGPGSAAYALYGYLNVMFVDVKVKLVNGETRLNRTLVIQDKNKKWYVEPRPDLASTLSVGLNEESDSTVEWKAPKSK
jgi:CO/xanthine dehydrogenase Mo-binding subunit